MEGVFRDGVKGDLGDLGDLGDCGSDVDRRMISSDFCILGFKVDSFGPPDEVLLLFLQLLLLLPLELSDFELLGELLESLGVDKASESLCLVLLLDADVDDADDDIFVVVVELLVVFVVAVVVVVVVIVVVEIEIGFVTYFSSSLACLIPSFEAKVEATDWLTTI